MTSPSAVEVEYADWTHLKAFATDLGLSPKGRSGFVRQRVLDHLREHAAPLGWRAGKATQAALLTRIGPADLAAGLWESAVTLNAPAAWVGLGTAYLKSERIEEALKCYDRAIAMGDASARLHKAQALMSAGKADRAMAEIEKTLGGSPANLRAWSMRVAIAEARRDSEETIASYRKIADLGRGRLGLAKILMRAGRFEEAEASLAAHLSDHPKDAVAWNNRGVCFAKRTQWKEAVDAFRRAVAIDPRNAGSQNNLAVALAGADRIDEAMKRIVAAHRIAEDPRILLNEAALRERSGAPAAARDVYARVLEIAPEHPEAVAGSRRVAVRRKPASRRQTRRPRKPAAKRTKTSKAKRSAGPKKARARKKAPTSRGR